MAIKVLVERKTKMRAIILNKDVYDDDGTLVLTRGTEITMTFRRVRELQDLGVFAKVIQQIEEETLKESYVNDAVLSELAQSSTVKTTKEIQNTFPGMDIAHLQKATDILRAVLNASDQYAWRRHVSFMFSYMEWLYAHSVNTAVISCMMGISLGYDDKKLVECAIGAFFHDIGLTLLPRETLEKPSKLTDVEYAMVKNHCEMGYAMLKDTGIPEVSQQIILQHHERMDGTGYPHGLKGDEISEASFITMIAEYFDTATTARSYKAAEPGEKVFEQMYKNDTMFPRHIVEVLKENML